MMNPIESKIPSIYKICFKFINFYLKKYHGNYPIFILCNWLFLSREYSSVQGIDDEYKLMLSNNLVNLVKFLEGDNISCLIIILEEYFLGEYFSYDILPNILEILTNIF